MDKLTKEQIIERVELAGSKGDAIEILIREGVGYKEAEKAWKEHGSKTVSRGFKPKIYAYLREDVRTVEEVERFIKDNGSPNDLRWKSLYIGISELTNNIHADAESE